ncbi:hypothetical protein [Moorena sp. SIOASIH]|nr:hypothetical protein [Moorena sp. SIOASIH]
MFESKNSVFKTVKINTFFYPTPYSLLPTPYSLLPTPYSLLYHP